MRYLRIDPNQIENGPKSIMIHSVFGTKWCVLKIIIQEFIHSHN